MTNRVGRPRKAESFRRLVVAALAEEPAVPTRVLLERATAEGYDGQKSAFYALVASERDPSHSTQRRRALAGELSRHDVFDVGRSRLFVSRLEYSRYVAVSMLTETGVEPIARALCAHFAAFGGVPLLAIFDSTRAGVAGGDSVAPLAYLGLDLGVGIELPEASRGRAGASSRLSRTLRVELAHALSEIKHDAEVPARIAAFVEDHNLRVVDEMGESPIVLLQEERRRLRPMRVPLHELTLRVQAVVQPGSVIAFDGRRWFVRAAVPGTSATVFLSPSRVRIVAGNASAIFAREA